MPNKEVLVSEHKLSGLKDPAGNPTLDANLRVFKETADANFMKSHQLPSRKDAVPRPPSIPEGTASPLSVETRNSEEFRTRSGKVHLGKAVSYEAQRK